MNIVNLATEEKQNQILGNFPIKESKIMKSKVFESNGTFTVPTGVTEVYLTGCGGGGGGSRYHGGGGARFIKDYPMQVVQESVISITVGSGGKGTDNTEHPGAAGGATSFGALITLTGGGGAANILTSPAGVSGGIGGADGSKGSLTTTSGGSGGHCGYFSGGAGGRGNNGGEGVAGGAGGFGAGGGASGTSTAGVTAGSGGRGFLTVKWWE